MDSTSIRLSSDGSNATATRPSIKLTIDGISYISTNAGSQPNASSFVLDADNDEATDTLGGASSSAKLTVQEDNLGLGSFADIPGALTYCYMQEDESNSCSMTFIRFFESTDVIQARILRSSRTTNFETTADASRLTIECIR